MASWFRGRDARALAQKERVMTNGWLPDLVSRKGVRNSKPLAGVVESMATWCQTQYVGEEESEVHTTHIVPHNIVLRVLRRNPAEAAWMPRGKRRPDERVHRGHPHPERQQPYPASSNQ